MWIFCVCRCVPSFFFEYRFKIIYVFSPGYGSRAGFVNKERSNFFRSSFIWRISVDFFQVCSWLTGGVGFWCFSRMVAFVLSGGKLHSLGLRVLFWYL